MNKTTREDQNAKQTAEVKPQVKPVARYLHYVCI
jgi:hypothetical protein